MIKIACRERDRRPTWEIVAQKPVRGHVNGAPHSASTARPHSAETMVVCLPLGLQLGKLAMSDFQGGELKKLDFRPPGWAEGACAKAGLPVFLDGGPPARGGWRLPTPSASANVHEQDD